MIKSKKEEFDGALSSVLEKIDKNIVTCEDFNRLIGVVIGETTPESVRDRLRRRTIVSDTESHIEPESGHQSLELPTFAGRIQPKIKPRHQQNHGRSRIAHAHSARTQAINAAVEFVVSNHGKPITEELLSTVTNTEFVKYAVNKLIMDNKLDRDWLYQLFRKLT